jgi:hypothetical protein
MSKILVANRYGTSQGEPVSRQQQMVANRENTRSIIAERNSLMYYGTAFKGARDYYELLGYPLYPTVFDYRSRFERDPIASRIVEFPAEETWRDTPTIRDGKDKDAVEDTPFATEWAAFAEQMRVYSYCQRVDTLAGIGRYGLLHIGIAGSGDLLKPVTKLSNIESIIYLQAYGEESVSVYEWQTDPANPRYGLPHIYRINTSHMEGPAIDNFGTRELKVHWSRCIHVAEGLLENEVYGRPRLQRAINLLDDMLKVVGGSAEATWLLMRKGFVLNIDPDMNDLDANEEIALNDQFEEYEHGIRRFIKTRGMNVKDLGSEVVDPAGLFDAILTLISIATHIPKRILQGSEAGQLASSQDAASWAGYIAGRQLNFAEPVILRPLIDRLVQWKAIPKPSNRQYTCSWDALFEMSDAEKANNAGLWANAFLKMSQAAGHPVVMAEEFRGELTPFPSELPPVLKKQRVAAMQPPTPDKKTPATIGKPSTPTPVAVPGSAAPGAGVPPPNALMNSADEDMADLLVDAYDYDEEDALKLAGAFATLSRNGKSHA